MPVRKGVLPSEDQMRKLFYHESTRFGNPKDRDGVVKMYLELRAKVEAFEHNTNLLVRSADERLTGVGARWSEQRRTCTGLAMLFFTIGLFVSVVYNILGIFFCIGVPVLIFSLHFLPSRILRAHLAAVLCCCPRDSREYTFRWSLRDPPFRPRPRLASGLTWQHVGGMPKSGIELTSTELAAALETKTGFTTEEWAAFGIADLQFDHFIKVGGTYYQPFEIPEGFRPSMRSQRNGRPHARTPVLQGMVRVARGSGFRFGSQNLVEVLIDRGSSL